MEITFKGNLAELDALLEKFNQHKAKKPNEVMRVVCAEEDPLYYSVRESCRQTLEEAKRNRRSLDRD